MLVAKAALSYWEGQPGTYLDLEDNCHPAQRADFSLIQPASERLRQSRSWLFIHLSRFPAPTGVFDPETCADTPLTEYGGPVYRKLYGTNELAQAMLDHTDFAARIASANFSWTRPYDEQFGGEMLYVVYPAIFQRATDEDTPTHATELFRSGLGEAVRNFCFTPWVYTTFDFVNAHSIWALFLLIPVGTIWCITVDHVVAGWCFAVGFIVCWGLGFR